MISGPKATVDTRAVKKLPALEKELAEIDLAIAAAKKAGDDTRTQEEERTGLLTAIDKIEASLAEDLTGLVARQQKIEAALSDLVKEEIPPSLDSDFKKLLKNQKDRTTALPKLTAIAKKAALRESVDDLTGLCAELEQDVDEVNSFEAGLPAALEAHYRKEWERDVSTPVAALAKKEAVNLSPLGVSQTIAVAFATLKKARYLNYGKAVTATLAAASNAILAQANLNAIGALHKAFSTLNKGTRDGIINKALKAGRPVAQVQTDLQAALDNQRQPTWQRWQKLLQLKGYQVLPWGKFGAHKIHITLDNNSWGPKSNGGMDLSKLSAKAVVDGLFDGVSWQQQVHATLETQLNDGNYPHVYWDGTAIRWTQVQAQYGGSDAGWSTKAQKALNDALADFAKDVATRVAAVQKRDGSA